jgi:hypothetical protein
MSQAGTLELANGATVDKAVAPDFAPPVLKPRQKVIVVCTPTLGEVSMDWAQTLCQLSMPMNVSRGSLSARDIKGGEIGELRNKLVSICLEMEKSRSVDIDSILWLDDDVICHPMVVCALARHETDIASGVYFCKGEMGQPLIFAGPSQGTLPWKPTADHDEPPMQAWGWAQGLCLIRLEVYKRMLAECPDMGVDQYGNPRWYHKPDFGFTDNGLLTVGGTEDFPFFERAGKLGYKPVVDCCKFAFGWHYDKGIQQCYPRKQWKAQQDRKPIVWRTKDGEVVWE